MPDRCAMGVPSRRVGPTTPRRWWRGGRDHEDHAHGWGPRDRVAASAPKPSTRRDGDPLNRSDLDLADKAPWIGGVAPEGEGVASADRAPGMGDGIPGCEAVDRCGDVEGR